MVAANTSDTKLVNRAKRTAKAAANHAAIAAHPPLLLRASFAESPFDGEERHGMIEKAAYFRAEQRGFQSGNELDDWLAAEAEVNARSCNIA